MEPEPPAASEDAAGADSVEEFETAMLAVQTEAARERERIAAQMAESERTVYDPDTWLAAAVRVNQLRRRLRILELADEAAALGLVAARKIRDAQD